MTRSVGIHDDAGDVVGDVATAAVRRSVGRLVRGSAGYEKEALGDFMRCAHRAAARELLADFGRDGRPAGGVPRDVTVACDVMELTGP